MMCGKTFLPRTLKAALALLLLGSAGCATQRVPFLHRYRAPKGLDRAELKKLQFYVSNDLVLRREVDTSDDLVTQDHVFRSIDGRRVEEVHLPKGTPGLVVRAEASRLFVSFEKKGELVFEVLPGIVGKSTAYHFPFRNRKKVLYRGKIYRVIQGGLDDRLPSSLLVDARWESRFEDRRRVIAGRSLDQ